MYLASLSFLSIILCIISLGLLVAIHEFGHFIMAKTFNVYVNEFSIGFGPQLFRKKKGETTYSLRAIPLGGYVSMFGEGVEIEDVNVPQSRSLLGIKKWKRALIMSAGIILNFVLGFVLFFINNAFFAQPYLTNQVTVEENSVIENLGLVTGDYIIKVEKTAFIDGNQKETVVIDQISPENPEKLWNEAFAYAIEGENGYDFTPKNNADTLTLKITYVSEGSTTADPKDLEVVLNAVKNEDESYGWSKMGISTYYEYRRYETIGEMVEVTNSQFANNTTLIAKTLGGLFVGKNWNEVGGPISILTSSSEVLNNYGFGMYLYLWGAISVNLAIFNLIPFPGLDGWHLLVVTVEGIFKKEIPEKVKNVVSAVGMILLFGLMFVILCKDIIGLF